MARYALGKTDLEVTDLCFGTSALGDMPDTYGYSVDEERALDTIRAIFDSPVNFIDSSRNYGFGRSEERVGQVIKERGGLPQGFVLSTKLDRDMETGRFDAARVRQSVEESLKALNLDTIPLLHLHDPEHARDLSEITGEGGALDELFKLKDEGIAQAVGLAMGRIDIMFPILRDRPFDALISHNRYTLLNRAADEMFDYAYDNDIAILNAAPFAGGVLAKGADQMKQITYQPATDEALEPIRAIEDICVRHGIAPGAAALGFSLRDPRVTSTIIGVSKPERVQQTLDWAATKIPAHVWDELDALPFDTTDPEANRDYRPG
ncbi:aldo/keto reductase [Sagittula sp. S175]|uniref:aldo/keto reductase n=1 Tax=Sagittula sp. S175 TaxID=3415129 RepID=UPI003C7B966C